MATTDRRIRLDRDGDSALVARLEAKVALEEFLARFPEYEIDGSGIDSMRSADVQGPMRVRLPVG